MTPPASLSPLPRNRWNRKLRETHPFRHRKRAQVEVFGRATHCLPQNGLTMDSHRAAIEEHWRASERGDTEAEHAIYAEQGILDYPQSGERFRGRATIA